MRMPLQTLSVAVGCAVVGAAPSFAQQYSWPTTQGATITSQFDNNATEDAFRDYKCGSNSYDGHKGTDIGVGTGTTVRAARAGTVNRKMDGFGPGYLGNTDGYGFGNHVSIAHDGGHQSIYAHLTAGSGLPAQGTSVDCGSVIGRSGSSGNVTGPHLHFETRTGGSSSGAYGGIAVDPFEGSCSSSSGSLWNDQNGGSPLVTCEAADPPPDDPPDDPPPTSQDDADLLQSLTIPDGTTVVIHEPFNKGWRIRNSGVHDWSSGYELVHVSGPSIGPESIPVALAVGEEANINVLFVPRSLGTAEVGYRMAKGGDVFGDTFSARVEVAQEGNDADGDGVSSPADCDDANPEVHPGGAEMCDGQDSDCSGGEVEDYALVRSCCSTGTQQCTGITWGQCDELCEGDGQPMADGFGGGLVGTCSAGRGGGAGGIAWLLLVLTIASTRRRRR